MANQVSENPTISIVNQSHAVNDNDLEDCFEALRFQLNNHFLPAWKLAAELEYVGSNDANPENWWLVILDDSDRANATGYHDLNPNGLPIGKVFAQTDIDNGRDWCVTASHELLEMIVDPYLTQSVDLTDPNLGQISVAKEICDPCEGAIYTPLNSISVADFVLPSWFDSYGSSDGTQCDYLGRIMKPFHLLGGGYISYQPKGQTTWNQFTADLLLDSPKVWSNELRPRIGTRRERRNVPRNQWVLSSPNGKKFKRKHPIKGLTIDKKSRSRFENEGGKTNA